MNQIGNREKFRPGDIVMCIDNSGVEGSIQCGQCYTISSVYTYPHCNGLYLAELPWCGWFKESCFEFIK